MVKKETEFSKFAQAFREIIDGNKTDIDILTKELLKMGLTVNDKIYINKEYPEYTDEKGKRHIEGNKGGTLRKYYGGTNGLSRLIPDLETEFDEEFQERYCEELQDYDESRIMAFARGLNIDVNENDIDIVSEAVANYYSSIVIGSATKKSRKPKIIEEKSNNTRKSNDIIQKYTLSPEEKNAILVICEQIDKDLQSLDHYAKEYFHYKDELDSGNIYEGLELTDEMMIFLTEKEKMFQRENVKPIDDKSKNQFKEAGKSHLSSASTKYDYQYLELQEHCSDLLIITANKLKVNDNIKRIYDIGKYFCDNKLTIDEHYKSYLSLKQNTLKKCVQWLSFE
ncbi:hypothetical protein [Ruminococcus flavefaciens]|uniref:hypothetical protein n=1 Tax=Ruminococcus flavefaciens TaxID=1265 RepID=UPI0026EEC0AC|nr:hypothetical protein [Ruminococcus flavefaciens]MDD7518053.1 hypothetical protein [Ruminococcus flavefaciens]MDY5692957.1 hypothetical protein [Ruminococcus flavefaciens]